MKAILFLLFLSGISCAQFDIQTQWENDFMTSNWLPDTVVCYDCETTYPVPFYEIKTYVVGFEFEKIEAGDGYYILVHNKYRSVWTERKWIRCFGELNMSVSQVVKAIRLAKLQPKYASKEFAMFLKVDLNDYYHKYPTKK